MPRLLFPRNLNLFKASIEPKKRMRYSYSYAVVARFSEDGEKKRLPGNESQSYMVVPPMCVVFYKIKIVRKLSGVPSLCLVFYKIKNA